MILSLWGNISMGTHANTGVTEGTLCIVHKIHVYTPPFRASASMMLPESLFLRLV